MLKSEKTNNYYKKIYTHKQFYRAIVLAFMGVKYIRLNRKKELISPQFQERIMLVVTEVNGCEACSYAHTKFALEEGMTSDEIEAILSGDTNVIPKNELVATFFAQHYTNNNGIVSEEAWNTLVREYGEESALIVLAFVRMMIVGNIYGMAISAIGDRFKRKHTKKTNLFYELSIIFLVLIYFPVGMIHAFINNKILKKSFLPFDFTQERNGEISK